jgi:hypothetical protein
MKDYFVESDGEGCALLSSSSLYGLVEIFLLKYSELNEKHKQNKKKKTINNNNNDNKLIIKK